MLVIARLTVCQCDLHCAVCIEALCVVAHAYVLLFNPLASEKIRTDSRIREIQALTPFN